MGAASVEVEGLGGVPLLEALKVRDVVAELGVHGQPGDSEHEEEGVGDEDDPHDVDW